MMYVRGMIVVLMVFVFFPLKAQQTLKEQIEAVIEGKKAKIGVAVLMDGQEAVTIHNDRNYAMLSTFKFPLALAVLHYLDQYDLSLHTDIFVAKSDLKPNTYSPLRDARPEGDFNMSVGELLKLSVALSDNNACDILIKYIGGTASIQGYMDQLGIPDMKIKVTEDEMHQESGNLYLNSSTPLGAVLLMERFLKRDLLAPEYQDFLEETLIATTTGVNKLKGLLPADVVVGHKTGSSDRDAAGLKIADNDWGFVYLPNGKHYSIVVFVTDSMEDDQHNAAIIARISKVVYDYYSESQKQ